MLIAGYFNCIVSNTDGTGTNNHSRALTNIMHGFGLIDTCDTYTSRRIYTHCTSTGASKIDRMYVTRNILSMKESVETVATTFPDHLAVIVRITMNRPLTLRGRGCWRLNVSLNDKNVQSTLRKQWTKRKTHKKYYSYSAMWRGRYIKKTIQQLFINEGTERS
jgi:hypothetical protein